METKSFSDGYNFTQNFVGAQLGNFKAQNYINEINKAISDVEKELNSHDFNNNWNSGVAGGYAAEVWHKGTFNIDAKLKEIKDYASIPERNGSIAKQFAQADIETLSGDKYGLKYYKNGRISAKEQATTYWERYFDYKKNHKTSDLTFEDFLRERGLDPETTNKYASIYEGQFRIVPCDQIDKVKEVLQREILQKNYYGEDTSGLEETLSKITDRVKNPDGVESIPLSKEDSVRLALLAKEGKLELKDFGINTENLVSYEYIFKQGLNAGINSAVISMVLKLGPEIYKTIDKLVKEGKINLKDFENLGISALSGATKGFINGSISATVTTACLSGTFGASLKTINPSIIGTLTVLITNTITYTIQLNMKKISKQEFSKVVSKDLLISSCSIGLGTLTQLFIPELPAFAFLVGSFIGSIAGSFVYEKGYSKYMSFCCDTGFTCFGLVEQNYKIPDEILKSMNIKSFDFKRFDIKSFDFKSFNFKSFDFKSFNYETVGIRVMSRDIIGISKIGYKIK